jgi:hypothetical protein
MQPDLIDVPAERNTREHWGERVRQVLPETQHVIQVYKKLYKWDCLSRAADLCPKSTCSWLFS